MSSPCLRFASFAMLSKNDIKYVRSLGQSKFREQFGCFIAEGSKLIAEFYSEGMTFERVYATLGHQLPAELDIQKVSPAELARISQLTNPQDALAIIPFKRLEAPKTADEIGDLVILCDRLQDPGNLGTIIRTADWFGVKHVICSLDTADPYAPKVVQATMGSLARVSVSKTDLGSFVQKMRALDCKHKVIASTLGGQSIYSSKMESQLMLVLGNESKGVRKELIGICDTEVTIPGFGGAESLNAAISAAIFMAEFRRINPRK